MSARPVLAFTMTRRGKQPDYSRVTWSPIPIVPPRTTIADLLHIEHAVAIYAAVNQEIGVLRCARWSPIEAVRDRSNRRYAILIERAARLRRIVMALVDQAAGHTEAWRK